MNVKDLDDWTLLLDREIASVRQKLNQDGLDSTVAVLDNSFAELHAASNEIKAQQGQLERVLFEEDRTRRRYEALLQLVRDGVIETDEFGSIREVNDIAAGLLNVRPDYLPQKPFVLFVAEADRVILNNILRILDGNERVIGWDITLQPRGASPVPLSVSAQRLEDELGRGSILWVLRNKNQVLAEAQAPPLSAKAENSDETVIHQLDLGISDRLAGIRRLSRRVVELQDMEGQKLARELREKFGQSLGAIKLNLENLGKVVPELNHAPLHYATLRLVDSALKRLREIYFDLNPPVTQGAGLVAMIRQVAARVPDPQHLTVTVQADPLPSLSPPVESAALWVVREALSNVIRHSGATVAEVRVQWKGGRLVLSISDNGGGFDASTARGAAERAGCFGIVGMEERVAINFGDFHLFSTPGKGTEVQAVFPAGGGSSRVD